MSYFIFILIFKLELLLLSLLLMYVHVWMHRVSMWRSEDKLNELIFFPFVVGSQNQTRVGRFAWQVLLFTEPSCKPNSSLKYAHTDV